MAPAKKLCPQCFSSVPEGTLVMHLGKLVCPACASIHKEKVKDEALSKPVHAPAAAGEEPLQLNVEVKNLTFTLSGPMTGVGGSGSLGVHADGMALDHNGMVFTIAWKSLRELKNELQTKQSFDANWGSREQDARMRITVKREDVPKLAPFLQRLSREATGTHCPYCPGVCLRGICLSCGRSAAHSYRLSGILYIAGGALVGGLGIALTVAGEKSAQPGGSYRVFTGLMAVGAILALRGLFRLTLGKKS